MPFEALGMLSVTKYQQVGREMKLSFGIGSMCDLERPVISLRKEITKSRAEPLWREMPVRADRNTLPTLCCCGQTQCARVGILDVAIAITSWGAVPLVAKSFGSIAILSLNPYGIGALLLIVRGLIDLSLGYAFPRQELGSEVHEAAHRIHAVLVLPGVCVYVLRADKQLRPGTW